MSAEKENNSLTINFRGQPLDVSSAWPLKWKHIKGIKALGVTDEGLSTGDEKQTEALLLYIIKIVKPEATPEDVDELTTDEIGDFVKFLDGRAKEITNRPTSKPSTS